MASGQKLDGTKCRHQCTLPFISALHIFYIYLSAVSKILSALFKIGTEIIWGTERNYILSLSEDWTRQRFFCRVLTWIYKGLIGVVRGLKAALKCISPPPRFSSILPNCSKSQFVRWFWKSDFEAPGVKASVKCSSPHLSYLQSSETASKSVTCHFRKCSSLLLKFRSTQYMNLASGITQGNLGLHAQDFEWSFQSDIQTNITFPMKRSWSVSPWLQVYFNRLKNWKF